MSERTSREYDQDRVDDDYDTNPSESGKWISAIIALAGLWLVIEPFLIDPIIMGNFWNDIVVGVLLIVLGGYNYYRRTNEKLGSTAAAALAALLGLWLIVAPFVYDLDIGVAEVTTELGFWNDVIVGLIVLLLGAYSAYETRDVDVASPTS
jgi:hypothetical protein